MTLTQIVNLATIAAGPNIYGYLPVLYDDIEPRVRLRAFLFDLTEMYR